MPPRIALSAGGRDFAITWEEPGTRPRAAAAVVGAGGGGSMTGRPRFPPPDRPVMRCSAVRRRPGARPLGAYPAGAWLLLGAAALLCPAAPAVGQLAVGQLTDPGGDTGIGGAAEAGGYGDGFADDGLADNEFAAEADAVADPGATLSPRRRRQQATAAAWWLFFATAGGLLALVLGVWLVGWAVRRGTAETELQTELFDARAKAEIERHRREVQAEKEAAKRSRRPPRRRRPPRPPAGCVRRARRTDRPGPRSRRAARPGERR